MTPAERGVFRGFSFEDKAHFDLFNGSLAGNANVFVLC